MALGVGALLSCSAAQIRQKGRWRETASASVRANAVTALIQISAAQLRAEQDETPDWMERRSGGSLLLGLVMLSYSFLFAGIMVTMAGEDHRDP